MLLGLGERRLNYRSNARRDLILDSEDIRKVAGVAASPYGWSSMGEGTGKPWTNAPSTMPCANVAEAEEYGQRQAHGQNGNKIEHLGHRTSPFTTRTALRDDAPAVGLPDYRSGPF